MMVVRETRRVELEKKRVKLGERMSDIRRRRGEIERREEIERRKHDIRRRRMEKIKRREITMEGVKMESCQFSKDLLVLWFRQLVELRVDMAEMSTMIREGEHRGKYYWATLYGVQPGQRYWVQWGISIKDRFGSYESDYRVWISDKHKMATNDPRSSGATPMLIYQPQRKNPSLPAPGRV